MHADPISPHYPDFFPHDFQHIAQALARDGSDEAVNMAEQEYSYFAKHQQSDGFAANIRFAPKTRKFDLERILAFGRHALTSTYMFPNDLARTAAEIYQGRLDQVSRGEKSDREALEFLNSSVEPASLLLNYWDKYRTNGEDKLKFVITRQETGRDSSTEYDHWLNNLMLPEFGAHTPRSLRLAKSVFDYVQITYHGVWLHRNGWDLEAAKKSFAPKDLEMNCKDAVNRYIQAELLESLGRSEEAQKFKDQAKEVEDQILTRMWFPKDNDGDGVFWSLNKDNKPIKELTISNLYPLLLPNLSIEQKRSLHKTIVRHFNPPFPLPTVATTSRRYDPNNHVFDRLSRGPTWIHHNRQLHDYGLVPIILGLLKSGDDPALAEGLTQIAQKIKRTTQYALDTQDAHEHFHPETFEGQRKRVGNKFAWSWCGYLMLPETVYVG